MAEIQLFGATVDSTLLFQIVMPTLSIIVIFFAYLNWHTKLEQERDKRCEELKGYIREHSQDLVNEVFNKWFNHPLEYKPYFERRNSKNEESKELIDEKYKGMVIEHLQDKEYLSVRKAWESRTNSKKDYSTKTAKLWEDIKQKVKENIPAEFIKWDEIGTRPSTCYVLDSTVSVIIQEANNVRHQGKLQGFFMKVNKGTYFQVGNAVFHAQSTDEELVDKFIRVVNSLAEDNSIAVQVKLVDDELEKLMKQDKEFKDELMTIIDDVERGHYILKGSCRRCKSWVNELLSLDNS